MSELPLLIAKTNGAASMSDDPANRKPTFSPSRQDVNRRNLLLGSTSAIAATALASAVSLPDTAQAQQSTPAAKPPSSAQPDRTKLPMPEPPFGGKIGKTYQDSTAGRRTKRRHHRAR